MSHFIRETDGGTVVTIPTTEVKQTRGGLQLRWKLPTGGKMSLSEAPLKEKVDKAHFHKGLTEVYTVHEGFLVIIINGSHGVEIVPLEPEGNKSTFVATPFTRHLVYQPCGVVFVTQTVGVPVPNPERGNNDWWPDVEFGKTAAERLPNRIEE